MRYTEFIFHMRKLDWMNQGRREKNELIEDVSFIGYWLETQKVSEGRNDMKFN